MVVLPITTPESTTATPTPTPTPAADVDALAIYDDNGNGNGRISCAEARNHGIAPVRRVRVLRGGSSGRRDQDAG